MNLPLDELTFKKLDKESFPLADRFYANNKYKVRCGKLDVVYTLQLGGQIIAAVRLIQTKNTTSVGCLLLRNLCVEKVYRGQGAARKLMTLLLERLTQDTYLFSLSHLVDFYSSIGFCEANANAKIPDAIAQLEQTYRLRHRDWVLMAWASVVTRATEY